MGVFFLNFYGNLDNKRNIYGVRLTIRKTRPSQHQPIQAFVKDQQVHSSLIIRSMQWKSMPNTLKKWNHSNVFYKR